ncbi:hypothetical protein Hanom_Chr06g00567391 [Helianthus anomalus]
MFYLSTLSLIIFSTNIHILLILDPQFTYDQVFYFQNIEITGSSRPLVHHVAPIINLSIEESRVYRCRRSSRHISPDILFVAEQVECIAAANSLGSRCHIDIFVVAGHLDIAAVAGHIDIVAVAVSRWSSRDKLDNISGEQQLYSGTNVFVTTMDRPESVASNVYETPNGTR